MEGDLPIQIVVYDKDYNRKGYVMAPLSVTILLAWNVPGQTVFELDASHGRVNDLVTPGARCVVRYRPEETAAWMTVMSGLVSVATGKGGPDSATREFTVLDDLNALNEIISFPVPSSPLSDQSASAYDAYGPAPLETVFKDMVSAQVSGQGIPKLTVQADAGLGDVVRIRHRMRNLGEHMLSAGIRRGLGWRIVQTGTTRQLQAWEPPTHPRVLTEASGIVHSAEFTIAPPEVTRVVVGIGGKGTARVFYGAPTAGYVDTTAEALWGIRRQEFLDEQSIETTDPDREALALEKAGERLLEGKAKASLKAELAETGSFRFGIAYNLGDTVSIKPSGTAVITDRVREVEITWDTDGLQVIPRVGEWTDTVADAQWKAIRKALKRINDLGTV